MFCTAMRGSISFTTAKKLFRPGLKIAVKLAATGAFPPIVPVVSVVNKIPFVNRFAGADEFGAHRANLRDPVLVEALGTLELLALADYAGCMTDGDARAIGLTDKDRTQMQSMLADTIAGATDAPASAGKAGWIMSLGLLAMSVGGFYWLMRMPREVSRTTK
jgi:hypothetical protein